MEEYDIRTEDARKGGHMGRRGRALRGIVDGKQYAAHTSINARLLPKAPPSGPLLALKAQYSIKASDTAPAACDLARRVGDFALDKETIMFSGPMAKDTGLSPEELRHILDHLGDGVLIANPEGELVAHNMAAQQAHGLLIGEDGKLRWGLDPGADEVHPLAVALRGEQVRDTEYFLRTPDHPDGVWLSASAFPLKDSSGRVQGGMLVVRDITESKKAVEALRDHRARFRALFDGLFEFAGLLDPSGKVIEMNRTALDFAGCSLEDVAGRDFAETPWWEPDQRQRVRDAVQRAARGEFVRFDTIHPGRDGTPVSFDFSLEPVADDHGAVQFLIAEGRNIDARKREETRLAERGDALRDALSTQKRFGDLLDAAPDAIIEVNEEGRILFANAAAARAFEYPREELMGLSVDLLVPESAAARHREHRASFAANPGMRPMGAGLELQARRKSGALFPVEISLSPMQLEDGMRVVAIVRDITERRQGDERMRALQEQFTRELGEKNQQLEQRNAEVERSNRLKSEFLASMSHELRSPLHTIIGFAELLGEELEGPLNTKQKRFVANIHQDSQHLLEIINDLLDISKIEAGRMEYHTEPFAIAGAVDEVLSTIRPQAEAKSLTIDLQLGEGIRAEADRLRFKQVLVNLLTNAVKFTPEKGRISLSAVARAGRMMMTVTDTGVGIAREHHDAIFDNFYQVGSTTKGVREGTGLGLAITRNLVEQQGGSIWVESEPGKGSSFSFVLNAPPAPSEAEKPFVLIVESDAVSAELFVDYLRPEGFQSVFAQTVARGLSISEELQPDAIVIDLLRPSAEDWRQIREFHRNPKTSRIPVVVVSVSEEAQLAQTFGAAFALTKPVSKRRLVDTLESCFEQKDQARSVLVVDDEPLARELVQQFLQDAGFEVMSASDGHEALGMLGTRTPGAIILDLMMPEMSGFEMLSRLREDPRWAEIPVVVLTGIDLDDGQAAMLRKSAIAVLPKGRSWKKPLLTALGRALGK